LIANDAFAKIGDYTPMGLIKDEHRYMSNLAMLEALREFESAYQDLFALLKEYPLAKQLAPNACGVWSPKEVLAVIWGWLKEAQRRYPRYAIGTGEIVYHHVGFNAVSIRLKRGRSWDDMKKDLFDEFYNLLKLAQTVPAHDLERDARYAEWLVSLTKDCRQYTQDLRVFSQS
jgi:hypothetical protein